MSPLLTEEDRARLLANAARRAADPEFDPWPVVKLFTPDASAVWLLTDVDPEDPDLAFGLCDLGSGAPELGYVRLSEIESIRGALRLPVERASAFRARQPISEYARTAVALGYVDA